MEVKTNEQCSFALCCSPLFRALGAVDSFHFDPLGHISLHTMSPSHHAARPVSTAHVITTSKVMEPPGLRSSHKFASAPPTASAIPLARTTSDRRPGGYAPSRAVGSSNSAHPSSIWRSTSDHNSAVRCQPNASAVLGRGGSGRPMQPPPEAALNGSFSRPPSLPYGSGRADASGSWKGPTPSANEPPVSSTARLHTPAYNAGSNALVGQGSRPQTVASAPKAYHSGSGAAEPGAPVRASLRAAPTTAMLSKPLSAMDFPQNRQAPIGGTSQRALPAGTAESAQYQRPVRPVPVHRESDRKVLAAAAVPRREGPPRAIPPSSRTAPMVSRAAATSSRTPPTSSHTAPKVSRAPPTAASGETPPAPGRSGSTSGALPFATRESCGARAQWMGPSSPPSPKNRKPHEAASAPEDAGASARPEPPAEAAPSSPEPTGPEAVRFADLDLQPASGADADGAQAPHAPPGAPCTPAPPLQEHRLQEFRFGLDLSQSIDLIGMSCPPPHVRLSLPQPTGRTVLHPHPVPVLSSKPSQVLPSPPSPPPAPLGW